MEAVANVAKWLPTVKAIAGPVRDFVSSHREDIMQVVTLRHVCVLAADALRVGERTVAIVFDTIRSRPGLTLGACLIAATYMYAKRDDGEPQSEGSTRLSVRRKKLLLELCVFTPLAVGVAVQIMQESRIAHDGDVQRLKHTLRQATSAYESLCRNKCASALVVLNDSPTPRGFEARSQYFGMTKAGGGANQVVVPPHEATVISANATTFAAGRGVRLCLTGTERCIDRDHGQFVYASDFAQ